MLIKTATTQRRFSRRALLGSMGASAALLPILEPEYLRAQALGSTPKRLITIAWGNGIARSRFYPVGTTDATTTDVLSPLAPLASKVTLIAGLDMTIMLDADHRYDGHFSYPSMFTGTYRNVGGQNATSTGMSIDQAVANHVAETVNLPIPVMSIVVNGRSTSYRDADERNTGEEDAGRLFDQVFSGDLVTPEQLQLLRDKQLSVLDYVNEELTAYEARMGTQERTIIEAHLDSIRELETRLSAAAPTCEAPAKPSADGFKERLTAMADIAALAIRCDITRSVSMTWGDDGGSGGPNGDYHDVAHASEGAYDQKVPIDQYFYEEVAKFAQKLDAATEASGTVLDNSVIVVGNDMDEGAGHDVGGLGFVLVGSGGGYFKTGRTLRLGDWATADDNKYWGRDSGVPHNRLLASLGQAMGMDIESFGSPDYSGAIDELTTT